MSLLQYVGLLQSNTNTCGTSSFHYSEAIKYYSSKDKVF